MKRPSTEGRSIKTEGRSRSPNSPVPREPDLFLMIRQLNERYPMSQLIGKSYAVSRLWAWFSKIEVSPTVRVPVPRFLTIRDP